MNYTIETVREIWNEDGGHIEVGNDRDGLGLVEIRCYDENDKCVERFTFNKEEAEAVAKAIMDFIGEFKKEL